MTLQLFNTLSTQIEPLAPADGKALTLYACGPTVYDYGHIGNFRTFLHVDLLRRFLEQQGVVVKHVMNITDVDDKIIRNAAAQGVSIADYTPRYERAFLEDLRALGCLDPVIMPHATENIPEMVALIQKLEQRGLAYRTEDGSWYFRINGDPDYGKLSKKDLSGNTAGARVDVDEYEKDSASDFAMWKAAKPGEHAWDTVLGHGRPGWHIECSAMAMKFLGETLDLHAGGEDLMFPHHENEIAQSESATGKTFARHWMHVRFLLVEGRKMSKSEGNFFTLRDLLLRGYRASAIRFLLLSVPYRHQLNFTFDGLAESASAVERLRTFRQRVQHGPWPEGENAELLAQSQRSRARLHSRARQRPQHRRSPRRNFRSCAPRQHRRRPRQAGARQCPAHPRCSRAVRSGLQRASKIAMQRSRAARSPGQSGKANWKKPRPNYRPAWASATPISKSSSPSEPTPRRPATSPEPTPSATT